MSTSTKRTEVNTNEPNNRSNERPIYEANQAQNQNSNKKNFDDESPDCCFIKTFCCCLRDTDCRF